MSSILLCTSVPERDSSYHKDCDPMLIQAALRTFLYIVLGRKRLVFGGHPTISPLILAVCEDLRVDNKSAVTLYQSKFFEKITPKVNSTFSNLINVPATDSRDKSLEKMRSLMIRGQKYEAAVFIGGGEGILEEHRLFAKYHPHAKVIALKSPGGAAAKISMPIGHDYDELLNYVRLFVTDLKIPLDSERNLTSESPKLDPSNTIELG